MKITIRFWLLLVLLAASSGWAGEIYKWQDKKGVTRYSDTMPPSTARNVQKYKAGANGLVLEKPELTPEEVAAAEAKAAEEAAAKAAAEQADEREIVLFSWDECGPACKEAEAFMNKTAFPFTLRNKEADKAELLQRTGKLDAPVLYIGKEMRSGFQEASWKELLEATGYGKPGSPAGSKGAAAKDSRR